MRKVQPTDITGMDISGYDAGMDYLDAAGKGIRIAYIKATEGSTFADGSFAGHNSALRAAGIKTGAYHFFHFYAESTAAGQAQAFLQKIEGCPLDCAPAIDCEDGGLHGGLGRGEITQQALDFARMIENFAGVQPIFYSNTAFIAEHFTADIAKLGAWIADTRDPAGPGENGVVAGWVGYQYSFGGQVGGRTVDLDLFTSDVILPRTLIYRRGETPGAPAAQTSAPAQQGDAGIKAYQYKLNRIGIRDDSGQPLDEDGIDGPRTKQAVVRLERLMGLGVDAGIWGSECEKTYGDITGIKPVLAHGSDGAFVRYLQYRLGGLAADGIFGPATLGAVKRFQLSHGLDADGIVGPLTWGALIG